MSETPSAAATPQGGETASCPIALSSFPPALQRTLDPKSPVPVRLMAAKGIMVAPPRDFLSALYFLSFDPEPKVGETARQSAAKLQDKVSSGLRDEELPAPVLAYFAAQLAGQDQPLESIVLNQATPDETIAWLAQGCSDRIVEIIAQNQLRLLRDERIVRAIAANANCRPATKDGVLDFCVRSGLHLPDLPAYVEARRRVLGEDPAVVQALAEAEQNSLETVVAEFGEAITDEQAQVDEGRRLTFTQRVMKMSVAQKIKLATLGNKEARTLLLRDSNKLVALAAVQSPRITDGEIVALSNSRTLHDDVMRYITSNRELLKNYQVKVNLVNNPKCALGIAMRLLPHLHVSELKNVARNKNIPSTLQNQARNMMAAKGK